MTAGAIARPRPAAVVRRPFRPGRAALHLFLIATSLVWLFPLLWAIYTSFRPYSDTAVRGYVSLPGEFSIDNYINAWNGAELPKFFFNTIVVVLPAMITTLLLASMIAFAVSRFSWRFNILLLMVMVAGNLLPPQVIITPLFRLYLALPLPAPLSDNGVFYDQFVGIAAIHVAFQLGFCTFVLSNYMKTLPRELIEAALVDGASLLRTFWQVILPLCRPALAALATLQFTWVYNDFFWALVLMPTGAKRPITSGLNNLQGEWFTDNNLLAAGSILVALPTLIVYFALQRHFVRGLTLGSTKG
ncbi:MAG TPA: carbohydrate ABC transporter permease [Candidatus Limnocylindrales bacterium]|jgi:multiple sugar transport system permease protein|nr:carbohydrate ABC transporter permease [Candidatus Limnocylindrales bacterium]